MTKVPPDDLEAVRAVVAALQPFEGKDQERILRWVREKLGLTASTAAGGSDKLSAAAHSSSGLQRVASSVAEKQMDIRTFIDLKKPKSDIQYAAAVAYYYRFDATESQRKASITAADLQDAARQTGRARFKNPLTTLNNAHKLGYLDKGGDRGTYVVNTVGENLIAMALPEVVGQARKTRNVVSGRKKRV